MLAAAEVLSADLYHMNVDGQDEEDTPSKLKLLKGLYQRCTKDFRRIQQLVCEPVRNLPNSIENSILDDPLKAVSCAAQTVHEQLDACATIISSRLTLLDVQHTLMQQQQQQHSVLVWANGANALGLVLHRLQQNEENVLPDTIRAWHEQFCKQVQVWKTTLEACLTVEQCL